MRHTLIVLAIIWFAIVGIDARSQELSSIRSLRFDSTGLAIAKMIDVGWQNFTIEFWIKPSRDIESSHVFSFEETDSVFSYGLYLHDGVSEGGGSRVSVSLRAPNITLFQNSITGTSIRVPKDRWTHLALTRAGPQWKLYRNGELVGRDFGNPILPAYAFEIGDHFSGAISEFRIWNTAKIEDSIRANMYVPAGANDANLIINYDMTPAVSPGSSELRLLNRSRFVNVDSLSARLYGNVWIDSISKDAPHLQKNRPSVTLTSMPHAMQFFARDPDDSARVRIEGTVRNTFYDSAAVELEKNDSLVSRISLPLQYSSGHASVDLTLSLHAELSQYNVRFLLIHGDSVVVAQEADDLVCGDAFLITGQSNSHPADTAIMDQSPFLRTLGVQTGNSNFAPYDPADTVWGLANAHGFGATLSGPYLTGVWGYYLQQKLTADEHIPICVINGGAGGSTIEQNLPDSTDPTKLSTIYGKTLYRSQKAGLADKFKAIFWYQGESNTIQNYYPHFKTLYQSWKRDYPSIRKFYVFQVRPSWCGAGTTSALRDLQRTLGDSLPDIRVMSTASIPGHNGCHFSASGYNAIGQAILPLVEHDFYGGTDTVNTEPPNIKQARFTTSKRNEIALTFKGSNLGLHIIGDTLLPSAGGPLINYFYLDSSKASITFIYIAHDTVYLELDGPSNATSVTYLPEQYFNNTGNTYEGPTVVNARNVGAFTFDHVPIIAGDLESAPSGLNQRIPIQVIPNPFSESTDLIFPLDSNGDVQLEAYDVTGRQLETILHAPLEAGTHRITWAPRFESAGPVLIRIRTRNSSAWLKVVHLTK